MNLYELYVDGDKFYDVRINDLALIDPILELKTNNAGTLTFTLPPNHPKFDSFKPLTSTIEIFRDGEWFWEGRVIDINTNFYNEKSCIVEGALSYLNDSIQPQAEFHDIAPIGYVENLLNVHNSMVAENRKIYLGDISVRDPNNSMYRYTNYNSSLQELKEDMIDDLGGIINIRKKDGKLYLDVLDDPERICSQEIRLGQNLIDLLPSNDYTDIASVIIPLGATLEDQEDYEEGLEALDKYVEITDINDGKNYLAREDLVNDFDKIWKKVSFSNIHTPQGLMEKAKEYLSSGQWGEMVIEAKAFDLNYTDEEFQEFRLNDRVRVISEYHGIDRYFPLTAQTIHFNDPSQNTITLGGTGEPVSITGVTNQVTLSNEKLTERVKDPNRLIQQAIYQATELITKGLNGYVRVDGNEILIMDTDDPATAKHVWRWNMGGLGFSSNGYEGPFETAITMDGTIAGRFIAGNSIAAEQIDVNYTSHLEKQCNDYTDEKLGSYWTYSQTETYFKTLADQITAGVNTTLKGYVTEQKLESELSITESNITTSVSNTLKSYSKTEDVRSMIDQSAESITTTLSREFVGTDEFGDLQSSFNSLEQKITADGIFTTINNGIKGSQEISNTYFTMDRNGLTIQNGGITVKNSSGTTVLNADTNGGLKLAGSITTRLNSNSNGWDITGDSIIHYANGNLTFQILGGSSYSGNAVTAITAYNRPLVISPGSNGIQLVVDSDGLTFDCERGNIYVKRGGVKYTGANGFFDSNGRFTAQFINGICYSLTEY